MAASALELYYNLQFSIYWVSSLYCNMKIISPIHVFTFMIVGFIVFVSILSFSFPFSSLVVEVVVVEVGVELVGVVMERVNHWLVYLGH